LEEGAIIVLRETVSYGETDAGPDIRRAATEMQHGVELVYRFEAWMLEAKYCRLFGVGSIGSFRSFRSERLNTDLHR
jgi:hypothetical protein